MIRRLAASTRAILAAVPGDLRLIRAVVTCEWFGHPEPVARLRDDGSLQAVCPRCGRDA